MSAPDLPRTPADHDPASYPPKPSPPVASPCAVVLATMPPLLCAMANAGYLPLPLGVAGNEGSTVIVGLNGLRLLRNTARRHATPNRAGR